MEQSSHRGAELPWGRRNMMPACQLHLSLWSPKQWEREASDGCFKAGGSCSLTPAYQLTTDMTTRVQPPRSPPLASSRWVGSEALKQSHGKGLPAGIELFALLS